MPLRLMYPSKTSRGMAPGRRTVWQYIQSDHASDENLANALALSINAM